MFCHLVGTEKVDIKDLYKIVTPRYAAHWEDIGIFLNIKLGELETIKVNHPGDTSACCKDLWKKWLRIDTDATWEKLLKAIDSAVSSGLGMYVIKYML